MKVVVDTWTGRRDLLFVYWVMLRHPEMDTEQAWSRTNSIEFSINDAVGAW